MSSKDNPCRKFQANIFNKSKCQNCFKPRESHLLNDEDLNKAKPIYGGWLLLAPEGTNFDNPLHRSRKWQRRFFILYEHGLLRYALDEMPSTLPQGTINMNQCSDVIDGEARTGQKNSLCILTPDKEHFIRAESKEIINGWQETLVVYPRTNKQNQKKKRKVEAPTPQEGTLSSHRHSSGNMNGHLEPGPAKVTVTSSSGGSIPCLPSSIAAAEKVPASRSSLWQEERRGRGSIPCSRSASCLSQLGQSYQPPSAAPEEQGSVNGGRKARVESGYFSLEKAKPEPQSPQPPQQLSLSLSSPGGPGAPHRYSSSDTDPLTSPYYPSPDRSGGGDPFPSPRPLYSNGSSTISSSQSSLDSEASSTTPTSAASWDGRGGGGVEWLGGAGRAARDYASLSDVPKAKRLSHREAFRSDKKRQELRVRTRSPGREEVARLFGQERRRSQVIEKFESLEGDNVEQMETSSSSEPPSSSSASATAQRQGRSERRHFPKKQEYSLDSAKEQSMPDVSSSSISSYRRAKSLDRRVTESSMTPDLLNFKKGWMTKLYEEGLWKKHWFVLTDQSLRYYRDSIAEEAADLDGEIDLATCYDVTEYPVQRNYGFQIHTKEGAFTLSAMTSGIRRNWIQAIMKNVRPTIAPDVTRKNVSLKLSVLKSSSLPEERVRARAAREISHQPSEELCHTPETPAVQGETKVGDNSNSEQRKSRIRERRREGRSKTFDWAEFRQGQSQDKEEPDGQPEKGTDMVDVSSASSTTSSPSSSPPVSSASSPSSSSAAPLRDPPAAEEELEQERARRREERRRRFQAAPAAAPVTTASPTAGEVKTPEDQDQGRMEVDGPLSTPKSSSEGSRERGKPPDVQTEIEQRWHQVETTPLREEKQVPITTLHSTDPTAERLPPQELANLLDKELEQTQKELAKLQEQNSLLQAQLQDARGREQSAREGYVLQATCERGFAAMEETHQKVIEDIQRQHQREVSKLLEERERLLAEETAATIAAIEAMKNAHREELEKTQRSQLSGMSSDIEELRRQYEEELQSIHRELEVLSEQYSQKCLENAHLAQALEAERQALRQCQRENQELNAHNQELNNRLTAEITRMRSCLSGEVAGSPLTQGKDLYELEVLLRVKESEIQYLKQEIHSLKDELQSALRDKKYATDKYKDIYTELSIVKAKADCDISKLKEQLLIATEALGERSADSTTAVQGYDIMKSKSNPDFLKKERSSLTRQIRGVRSKSVIEQVSWDS
ncbi:myosin phosphatase Rho-interacting protein isoform X7 [Megalops cyprinoides]|uniref:myosin phosphatase Rho-interacting protein isoform X7 n=1 Tax=Megalops cyprinoides TaxID=118141 RepID=UPI001863E598|nr:myosin phosphatase Rho-interacting protein isoform X7 [Megalops cyprinoides]